MSQKFHVDHLPLVLNEALDGCRQIYEILNDTVKTHLNEIGAISGWGKSDL